MKKQMIAAIAFLALGLTAQASLLDTWSYSSKTFFNPSMDERVIFSMDLKDGQNATFSDPTGFFRGTYTIVDNVMTMEMEEHKIGSFHFETVDLSDGTTRQVFGNKYLRKLTFKAGSDRLREYQEELKVCYNDYNPVTKSMDYGKEFCKQELKKNNRLYATDLFEMVGYAKPLDLKVGSKFCLSWWANGNNTNLCIELDVNGKLIDTQKMTDSDGNVVSNDQEFKSWEMIDGALVLRANSGKMVSVQKLRNFFGIEQVVVSTNMNDFVGSTMIALGELAMDSKLNLSNLQMRDFTGEYVSMLGGSADPVTYRFDANGFGGFNSSIDMVLDQGSVFWKWEVENGLVVARRYFNEATGMEVQNEGMYQECMNAGDDCFVRQQRSYRVLSRKGNQITLERMMWHRAQKDITALPSSSIWVFLKK